MQTCNALWKQHSLCRAGLGKTGESSATGGRDIYLSCSFIICDNWDKFELLTSRSNPETRLICDEKCYMVDCIKNLTAFPAVKELWKSAEIWWSYRDAILWDTIYSVWLQFNRICCCIVYRISERLITCRTD